MYCLGICCGEVNVRKVKMKGEEGRGWEKRTERGLPVCIC